MKLEPEVVIDVLGQEIGRHRSEIDKKLEQKMDTAVGLAAIEVQRKQIEGIGEIVGQFKVEFTGLQDAFKAAHERQSGGEEINLKAFEATGKAIADLVKRLDHIDQLIAAAATKADLETREADTVKTLDEVTVKVDAINATIERQIEARQAAEEQNEAEQLNEFTDIVVQRIANLRKDVDAHLAEKQDKADYASASTVQLLREDIDHILKDHDPRIEAVEKNLPELIESVRATLDETRRGIEAILAEKLDRADNVAAFEILRGEIEKATDQLSDAITEVDKRVTEADTRSFVVDIIGKLDELKRTFDLELAEKVNHADSHAAIDELRQAIEPRIETILQRLAGIDADMAEIEDGIDHRTDAAIESWRGEFDDLRNRLRTTMLNVQEWQEETTKEITARLADIKDGEKGETGEKGVDGRDGVRGDKGEKGDKGDPGRDAIPWDHLGTYDPTKAYRFHDVVIKDGGSFLSVANNNTAVPGESPSWRLMAARGQRGKTGEQGPRGEPGHGVVGPVGPQGEAALPFIEIRAEAEHLVFIREDGEIFECSILPLLAALRGDARDFINEQLELAVAKAVKKALEGMKIK